MALPKKFKPQPLGKVNTFTLDPLNENVQEGDIVDIDEYTRYVFTNKVGEDIECYKVRGKNKEEYLVSLSFEWTLPMCDAIQYKRTSFPSLFLGESFIDQQSGLVDDGYAWFPVIKEFLVKESS